jgi:hypothetical protein
MTTTVKNLGAKKVAYSSRIIRPTKITVERAGPSGPSVWRNKGRPIITTLAEVRAHVRADDSGDPFWGRGAIVDGDADEPFLFSNDVQRAHFTAVVDASKAKPRFLYMTVGDVADVDKTGVDFWFNEAHIRIPYQANGLLDTFEIATTEKTLKVLWDSGTMPTKERPGGVADGMAIRFPCFKLV